MNQFELAACIAKIDPLRYTPAGLPASNLVLAHESEVNQAGTTRQVKLTVKAVAFGMLAEQASKLPLGQFYKFSGFLASARSNSSVVFHIQDFNPI